MTNDSQARQDRLQLNVRYRSSGFKSRGPFSHSETFLQTVLDERRALTNIHAPGKYSKANAVPQNIVCNYR